MKNNFFKKFKVIETNDESIVFQKAFSTKGKNTKDIIKLKDNSPTVTLHTFSSEELNRLKDIEAKILSSYHQNVKRKSLGISMLNYIHNFLDV